MDHKDGTWIDPEERAYPSGGFLRKARVRVRQNNAHPHPLVAPIVGQLRMVRASIPDTYFSIPARLRVKGQTVRGFISVDGEYEFTFTPEGRG